MGLEEHTQENKGVHWWLHRNFRSDLGVVSAYINGSIDAWVNSSHGVSEAAYAFGAQGFASFFSTGVTSAVVQHFSPIRDRTTSYIGGSLVPAALTLGLSIVAHEVNDTQEKLESYISPLLISLTTSPVLNFLTRGGYLRPRDYPHQHVEEWEASVIRRAQEMTRKTYGEMCQWACYIRI